MIFLGRPSILAEFQLRVKLLWANDVCGAELRLSDLWGTLLSILWLLVIANDYSYRNFYKCAAIIWQGGRHKLYVCDSSVQTYINSEVFVPACSILAMRFMMFVVFVLWGVFPTSLGTQVDNKYWSRLLRIPRFFLSLFEGPIGWLLTGFS